MRARRSSGIFKFIVLGFSSFGLQSTDLNTVNHFEENIAKKHKQWHILEIIKTKNKLENFLLTSRKVFIAQKHNHFRYNLKNKLENFFYNFQKGFYHREYFYYRSPSLRMGNFLIMSRRVYFFYCTKARNHLGQNNKRKGGFSNKFQKGFNHQTLVNTATDMLKT